MKAIDLHGQTFGRWTVLRRSDFKSRQGVMWRCRCTCGRENDVAGPRLRYGGTSGCTICWREKPIDGAKMRAMRKRGRPVKDIAATFGVCEWAVRRRVGTTHRMPNWMWQNYSKVAALKAAGKSWAEILAETGAPYSSKENAIGAFSRERRRRIVDRQLRKQIAEVQQLTAEGRSAAEIADELGIAERKVTRLRGVETPALDLPRIRKLLARGVNWRSIWSRLGRPVEDSQVLRAWFEVLDGEEAIAA